MNLWLVWENVPYQGDVFCGAYSTEELARSQVSAARRADLFDVQEITVDQRVNDWHGA